MLTSGAIKNPHCTNHLRYFLPFLCKIQVSDASIRSQLLALGLEPVRCPLSQFATRIYTEGERWGPVLKAARIPARKAS